MKSILVVDDEQAILVSLSLLLSEEGYEIRTANNGKEALERLAEKYPDLVLIDVMMPILTGFETIERMKADPHYAKIPIILMSGVRPQIRGKTPWDMFLRKPFEIKSVLSGITQLLSKSKTKH